MPQEVKAFLRINTRIFQKEKDSSLFTWLHHMPTEVVIGRTSFYKMKKQALGYLGFYFYEIVVPQAKDKRFKPSLGVEEE